MSGEAKTIGVLALQGDYEAHSRALERAGAQVVEVREAADFGRIDGLVIPGGESTTMLKLLREEKLFDALAAFAHSKPVFGTCAGAILLASKVSNPDQESLGVVDIDVERNAYGSQLDSRIVKLPVKDLDGGELEAVFIRAPIIRRAGPDTTVLASYAGDPVLVRYGRHLVATFHPELTSDSRVHRLFVDNV